MRFSGYTLPVNPSDASVRLTKEQLYDSLKLRRVDASRGEMLILEADDEIKERLDGGMRGGRQGSDAKNV